MSEIKKNGFELVWQIRNLVIHPRNDRKVAWCTFQVKSFGDMEWTLCIRNERLKLRATLLVKHPAHPSKVSLHCNTFVMFVEKSAFDFSENNAVDKVFANNSLFGSPHLEMKIHEDCGALFTKRNELLCCNSLTICCQLIPRDIDLPYPLIYFALSKGVKICKRFPVIANNFSSLIQDSVYENRNDGFFFPRLSISICKDTSIRINVINSEESVILLDCVFLMDANSIATKVWGRSFVISKSFRFPSTFLNSHLKDKRKFLSNDRLSLQFQFLAFCSAAALLVGEVEGRMSALKDNYISEFFEQCRPEMIQSPPTEDAILRNAPNSLNSDLQNLLSEGTLTDFELRFPDNSINAHKAVLCARSSVFKAMLTTDMKESADNWVDIEEDVDAASMQHLVNFMYSDSVPSLDWDSTLKLYAAADKYDVPQLKQRCSKFLYSNLSLGNVCSLLCLAYKHSDEDLKSAAHKIIFENDKTVMDSQEWKLLVKGDSKLGFDTMVSLYQMKLKP